MIQDHEGGTEVILEWITRYLAAGPRHDHTNAVVILGCIAPPGTNRDLPRWEAYASCGVPRNSTPPGPVVLDVEATGHKALSRWLE